jgi:uncharacterized protein
VTGPWRLVEGPAGGLRTYATATPADAPEHRAVLLCHELPRGRGAAADTGRTFPALADRLAHETGVRVAVGMLRGVGGSDGDFSAAGWLEDLACVVDDLVGPEGRVWLMGFDLGGSVALRLAVGDPRVAGVAALGSPADLGSWVADPAAAVARCRSSGAIGTRGFPTDVAAWADELVALRPLEAAASLGEKPLLVVHGTGDDEVPVAAARALSDAALGGPSEMRLVSGAGHWLRADPRVVATLAGWVERQR